MTSSEVVLKDDGPRSAVRIGDTVRRPTGPWTPAVHALLRYLEAAGFPYAPRALGIDELGREVLSYIAGQSGADGWASVVPEAGLVSFAQLLRAYHDAVRGFLPGAELSWAFGSGSPIAGEVICHNDFGPWNVVWRDGQPVGLIDWDLASPGPPMDDVAYALEYVAPFRDDSTALRWLRYERQPDRRRRIDVFASAYGLSAIDDVVDRVIQRQRQTTERVRHLATLGIEPQATWVADGTVDEFAARADWTENHRGLFE